MFALVCYSEEEKSPCEDESGNVWFNQTCYNATYIGWFNDTAEREVCNETLPKDEECWNETYNPIREWLEEQKDLRVTPSEEYFK